MIEKDPLSYTYITYLWVIFLASWGGAASYIRRYRMGGKVFSLPELVGELCISGFVGVMTFYLCEASEINQIASAALIGITGHMGSRAIFLLEKIVSKRLKINDDSQ